MINKIKLHKGIRKVVYTFFILANSVNAQMEFSKWYFGYQAGLDFSTSPPTALTNGSVNTNEGVATICDGSGNLLFYTEGLNVVNNQHNLMANGSGLFSNTSMTQAGIIVKQPGNNNIYFIFTVLTGISSSTGLKYSIVDMNLAAGLGSVTVKNAPLYTGTCEKQVAVRHCNGRDVWIVSHEYNTNNFRAYLLTSSGINPSPVISAVGEIPTGAFTAFGHIKISQDGKKLAVASSSNSVPTSNGLGGFHLFDFDAATGVVSNSLTLSNVTGAYGVEFSPDGTKLYGTVQPTSNVNGTLYQWNICAGSNTAIVASQYSVDLTTFAASVQWAIDGKLYIAIPASGSQSLHVINNPNGSGASMNLILNGQSIAPKTSSNGLPNYINTYLKPIPVLFSNTVNCQSVTFAVPSMPTFSSGCNNVPYPPGGYLWDFGEPASGAANSSTLANPVHTYSTLGTYTVSLILFNTCVNDTLKKVVTINTTGPNPSVAGTFTICKGDRHTYTVSGGSSYLWSNNSTATAVPLNPTQTTVYSVASTSNGCTLSKNFTVTVNACLGINNAGFDYTQPNIKIYPNPVKNDLFVESETAAQLYIFDNTGTLILEVKLNAGQNTINTIDLPAGFYNLKAQGKAGNWHGRVVKVE